MLLNTPEHSTPAAIAIVGTGSPTAMWSVTIEVAELARWPELLEFGGVLNCLNLVSVRLRAGVTQKAAFAAAVLFD